MFPSLPAEPSWLTSALNAVSGITTAAGGQVYTVNTFGTALQGVTSMGKFSSMQFGLDPICVSGTRYYAQKYTYGTFASGCSTALTPPNFRNALVSLACNVSGAPPQLYYVSESPTCESSHAGTITAFNEITLSTIHRIVPLPAALVLIRMSRSQATTTSG